MFTYLLIGMSSDGPVYRSRQVIAPRRHLFRPGAPLFEGVPYTLVQSQRTRGGMYVVVHRPFAADPRKQVEARNLYDLLAEGARTLPIESYLKDLRSFLSGQRAGDADRDDLWSLMFVQWVREQRPSAYLDGSADLGDAFLLGLLPPRAIFTAEERWLAQTVLQAIFGNVASIDPGRMGVGDVKNIVNFVADTELMQELISATDRRQIAMLAGSIAGESYAKAAFMLAGLLSGVTGVLVIDIVFQCLCSYLEFVADLREIEDDSEVTEDEAFGLWFSFAGIFLPFTAELRYLGAGLNIAGALAMAAAFLSYLIDAIGRALTAAQGMLDAAAAGFDDYAEQELASAFFIPSGS